MDASDSTKLVQTGPEMFEAGLAFRYQMPEGPGPYPTAVMLHGRFGNEDVMWIFRKTLPKQWLVMAPRAPIRDQGGNSWLIQPPDKWPDLSEFDAAVESLVRFLRALPRLYNADPDRMYLMGFSQGAAVSIATALRHPGLVRGIAGLVGFAPTVPADEIAGHLEGMPIFMAVGTKDFTVPYQVSQKSADLLRAAGADLEYKEYRTSHKMTAGGIQDLWQWFRTRV